MALVASPFLATLFAALQLGTIYLAQTVLETATDKTARSILTGTFQAQNATSQQVSAAICANLAKFMSCSNLLMDVKVYSSFSGADTSTPTLTYDGSGNVTNPWSFALGGPNDVVVLRVMYLMPSIGGLPSILGNQPGGKLLLISTTAFKNEPYQ